MDWPRTGKIKLHKMSLKYDPNGAPTLKDLRLEIESGFKIGVVGEFGIKLTDSEKCKQLIKQTNSNNR